MQEATIVGFQLRMIGDHCFGDSLYCRTVVRWNIANRVMAAQFQMVRQELNDQPRPRALYIRIMTQVLRAVYGFIVKYWPFATIWLTVTISEDVTANRVHSWWEGA